MMQRCQYVRWIGVGLIGCMLGLGGCGSAKAPTATLSQAELAVDEAIQSKASLYASL